MNLERMFEFLDIRDLVNVAKANTHFKVPTETVLAQKLTKRIILVHAIDRLFEFPAIISFMMMQFGFVSGSYRSKSYDFAVRVLRELNWESKTVLFATNSFLMSMNIATKRWILWIFADPIETYSMQQNIHFKMLKNVHLILQHWDLNVNTSIGFFSVCVN